MCYTLDVDSWKWVYAGFGPERSRYYSASVKLSNGSFLVIGGGRSESGPGTSEILSTIGDRPSFVPGPNLPEEDLSYHCACAVNSTHVFMSGGGVLDYKRSAYLMAAASEAVWRSLPDMIHGREDHFCGSVSGGSQIVVGGGSTRDKSNLRSVEIFSFLTMRWNLGPELPHPIDHAAYVAFGDSFLVIGGANGLKGTVRLFELGKFDHFYAPFISRTQSISSTWPTRPS